MAMEPVEHCPQCHSAALRRAKTRGFVDQLRRRLTAKRPHRCRECGWRGWKPERDGHPSNDGTTIYVAAETPDFRAVDAELKKTKKPTFRGL